MVAQRDGKTSEHVHSHRHTHIGILGPINNKGAVQMLAEGAAARPTQAYARWQA